MSYAIERLMPAIFQRAPGAARTFVTGDGETPLTFPTAEAAQAYLHENSTAEERAGYRWSIEEYVED